MPPCAVVAHRAPLHAHELLQRVVAHLALLVGDVQVLRAHHDDGRGAHGERPARVARNDEDTQPALGVELEHHRAVLLRDALVEEPDTARDEIEEFRVLQPLPVVCKRVDVDVS